MLCASVSSGVFRAILAGCLDRRGNEGGSIDTSKAAHSNEVNSVLSAKRVVGPQGVAL